MKKHLLFVLAVLAITITACAQQAVETPLPPMDNTPVETPTETPTEVPPVETGTEEPAETPDEPLTQDIKEVRVEMYDFGFDVTGADDLKMGDRIRITAVNTEGVHGLSIPSLGVDLKPGEGEELSTELVLDKAGTFDFRCNVPCGTGHRDMTGALVVE